MKTGAILGIQDMGAAGLTCSTCEMGGRSGAGVEIDLKHVPQRESDMTPYEIMLSESQERMLLVAERGREHEVFEVFEKWGLDAAEVGVVTDDGMLRVRNHGEVVVELQNSFLTDDAPIYDRPHGVAPYRPHPLDGPGVPQIDGRQAASALLDLLSAGDICSKRWIYEQYDYQVRTNTTAGPGGDAAMIRIKEAGVSLAMSLDGNGRYCALDPRRGAMLGVAECCRNLATVGATPLGTTNCLNFGNPEKPEIMAQLVEAIEGMGEACRKFETPITGGNVSLYNETLGTGIYPTPTVGVVGLVEGMQPPAGIDFKSVGRKLVLLGGLMPDADDQRDRRFGSSQFAKEITGEVWGLPPALDLDFELAVHNAARRIANQGLAESQHDLSDGGLIVAIAESTFGPARIGATVSIETDLPVAFALFHEAPSRILLSVAEENLSAVDKIAEEYGVPALAVGQTGGDALTVNLNGQKLFSTAVQDLFQAWDAALEGMLDK